MEFVILLITAIFFIGFILFRRIFYKFIIRLTIKPSWFVEAGFIVMILPYLPLIVFEIDDLLEVENFIHTSAIIMPIVGLFIFLYGFLKEITQVA